MLAQLFSDGSYQIVDASEHKIIYSAEWYKLAQNDFLCACVVVGSNEIIIGVNTANNAYILEDFWRDGTSNVTEAKSIRECGRILVAQDPVGTKLAGKFYYPRLSRSSAEKMESDWGASRVCAGYYWEFDGREGGQIIVSRTPLGSPQQPEEIPFVMDVEDIPLAMRLQFATYGPLRSLSGDVLFWLADVAGDGEDEQRQWFVVRFDLKKRSCSAKKIVGIFRPQWSSLYPMAGGGVVAYWPWNSALSVLE
jgi:hypothetical protein